VNCIIKFKNFLYNHILVNTLLLFSFIFISCSPSLAVLKFNPEFAESTYRFIAEKSEKSIINSPKDDKKLLKACETLTKFSFGFTMEEADRTVMLDYKKGKILYKKAHDKFVRAVDYGERALTVKFGNYSDWIEGKTSKTPKFTSLDLSYLFWTAGAYGGAIKSSQGDPEWIVKLPRLGKLLETALSLDSEWNKGALYSAMISYTMIRHDSPINKEDVAREYFNKAIKISRDLDLGPYVTLAESVSITTQNKNEFTNLLYKALNIDINSDPDLRLTNYINRNRAIWLLDNIDEYFY